MVRTRIENFENDINAKFSELNDRFNDFQEKYEMVNHIMADLFNLSFMTGVFPSALKIAKVVPVFKND